MLKIKKLSAALCVCGVATVACADINPSAPTTEIASIDNLDKKISIDFVNASLKDVLKIFTKQTGVNFVVDNNVADDSISLFLDKVTVRQALKSIAESKGLNFYPIEGTAVLRVGNVQEAEKDLRITKIYRLRFARVARFKLSSGAEISKTGELASGSSSSSSSNSKDEDNDAQIFNTGESDSRQGVINAVVALLSQDGVMSVDPRTNAMIVTDYPDRIKRIDRIIEELDKKTKQILIKAELIELSESFNDVLGATFGNANDATQLLSLKYVPPTVDGQVWPFDRNVLGISDRLSAEDGVAKKLSDTTFGKLSSGQFDLILKALKKSGKSKFLARPRIVTLDNEPAIVDISSDTAIQEDTSIDTDTNQQTVTVERTTVGVTLKVTPQINDQDFVTMILQPTVTDVAPSRLFPTKAFDPSTRSVLTKIRIKQGDTISIAGLIQKELSKAATKVPVLGEIPLLGALFTSKAKEGQDTDLIVFITPYILDDDDLAYLQKNADDDQDEGVLKQDSDKVQALVQGKDRGVSASEQERQRMETLAATDKIAQYEARVKEYPGDPDAHSNLGVAYAKAQKYDLAIEEFKKSIMLNPQSAAAYNNLGNLYRIKKQYDAAISALRRAVELAPDHSYAYTTLGLCYEMKDQQDEARAAYRQALKIAPNASWTNTARERLSVLDAGR